MALKEYKPEKLLYTMGEVTEMFDVKPSLIRFWEQRFDILKPKKNKKGNRLFTPADIKNLEIIYHLTKERGMTLSGVEKYLKNNKEEAERETEIVRRLQTIRSLLVEIREELKEEPEGEVQIFVDSTPAENMILPAVELHVETKEEVREEIIVEEEVIYPSSEDDQEAYTDIVIIPAFEEEIPDPEEFIEEELAGEIAEDEFFDEDSLEEPEPEDIPDQDVSVPFTVQPLFELEDTPAQVMPETTEPEEAPQEEEKPSAFDTQQSLF